MTYNCIRILDVFYLVYSPFLVYFLMIMTANDSPLYLYFSSERK